METSREFVTINTIPDDVARQAAIAEGPIVALPPPQLPEITARFVGGAVLDEISRHLASDED